MEQVDLQSLAEESWSECVPGYVTVKEAARIIGVSSRSVYGYLESGKLPGVCIGNTLLVSTEEARAYERTAPGRVRVSPPPWHKPPRQNPLSLTLIRVRVRLGQSELLEQKLHEMCAEKKHLLPGTAARYIACDECDSNELIILLVWRGAALPLEEERAAALAAFRADLAEALDWETAVSAESQMLLYA